MKSQTLHHNNRAARGFTLIEVLIGAAILGMMMLTLMASLRVTADSWETGEQRLIKANRLFITQSFLQKHIATLLPLTSVNGQGQTEPALSGSPNSLTYVAALPDQLEGGGLYRFTIYATSQDEHQLIRVSIIPYLSSRQSGQPEPEVFDNVVIMDHATTLKFSYFGVPQGQGGLQMGTNPQQAEWLNEWHEYQLPLLIRVDMGREGEVPWPTLFIAPKTQTLR